MFPEFQSYKLINIKEILSFLLILFFAQSTFSQYKAFDKNPYQIQEKFDSIVDVLKTNNSANFNIATQKLNAIESFLLKHNEKKLLVDFYYNCSIIYFKRLDLNTTYFFLNKGLRLAKSDKNYKRIGLYYEGLGVYYKYIGDSINNEKYYYLSEYYLKKYAPIEDQVDYNYNFAKQNAELGNWNKAIVYGNRCDSISKIINRPYNPYLYAILAESYLNINKLDKASYNIKKAGIGIESNKENYKLLVYYNKVLGDIYVAKGMLLKSKNAYEKSYFAYRNLNLSNINKINDNIAIRNQLEQKVFKLETEKEESILVNKNNVYKSYLIFLSVIIIIILCIVLFLQYKNALDKKKTNILLESKNSQLNEALTIKNRFLNVIAHELRTPLNAIKSIVFDLQEQNGKVKKDNINTLNSSVNYLDNLSKQILEYFNLNENNYTLNKEEHNLKETFIMLSETYLKHNKSKKELDFNYYYDDAISNSLLYDKEKLLMLLSCILDNAFKFSLKGSVSLKVVLVDDSLEYQKIYFEVKDTGIGISKADSKNIFELFEQGSKEISFKYGGTGIGLNIVRKILDLFEGKLILHSNLGEGTTVSFEVVFEKANVQSATKNSLTRVENKEVNILLVEDNKINQVFTKKILNKWGFNCDIAENGVEAIEAVKLKDYSLVITDIMMPVLDGFESSKIISEIKPQIPIVALTAVSESGNKKKFEVSKIKKVLNKPINLEELNKAVFTYILI